MPTISDVLAARYASVVLSGANLVLWQNCLDAAAGLFEFCPGVISSNISIATVQTDLLSVLDKVSSKLVSNSGTFKALSTALETLRSDAYTAASPSTRFDPNVVGVTTITPGVSVVFLGAPRYMRLASSRQWRSLRRVSNRLLGCIRPSERLIYPFVSLNRNFRSMDISQVLAQRYAAVSFSGNNATLWHNLLCTATALLISRAALCLPRRCTPSRQTSMRFLTRWNRSYRATAWRPQTSRPHSKVLGVRH